MMIRIKIIGLISLLFFAISCDFKAKDNKSENQSGDKISIEYLEDFTVFNNHEEVEEYFGSENVEKSKWYENEGTVEYEVTVVNPETKNKIIVFWRSDNQSYTGFYGVEAVHSPYNISTWELIEEEGKTIPSKSGLKIGDNLKTIEKINKGPFSFWGLGWDFGGFVVLSSEKLKNYLVRVDLPEKFYETNFEETMPIMGEVKINSDDPSISKFPIQIFSIRYIKE